MAIPLPCSWLERGTSIVNRDAEAGTPVGTLISGLMLVSRAAGIRGELEKQLVEAKGTETSRYLRPKAGSFDQILAPIVSPCLFLGT